MLSCTEILSGLVKDGYVKLFEKNETTDLGDAKISHT